jgi:hypothetical protein
MALHLASDLERQVTPQEAAWDEGSIRGLAPHRGGGAQAPTESSSTLLSDVWAPKTTRGIPLG